MIVFEQAKIVGNRQVTGEVLTNRLSIVAPIKDAVGFAGSLDLPSSYSAAAIDMEFTEAEITHEIPKLGNLKLAGCKASKFRLFREFADRLMVAFVIDYSGQPFGLTKHLTTIGAGEGTLTIKWPEQQKLIDSL